MKGSENKMALFGGRVGSGGNRASGTQRTVSTGAVREIQGSMGKGSISMELRNMSKGQTFEGTVIAVKGKAVTIESEGRYFNARMEDSVAVSIGEKISFVVRANSDNRIEIAPLRMGNIPMEELIQYKALEAAGLKATEKNMEIVKGLMKYQMGVNRDSIFHILGYLIKYPGLQIEDILLIKKIGNSIRKITIYQYGDENIEKVNSENHFKIKSDVDNQIRLGTEIESDNQIDSRTDNKMNRSADKNISNNFIMELETKHIGKITFYIQWEKTVQKKEKLYLFIQVETEYAKKILEEQENQWKNRLLEQKMICETEYISLENRTENRKKIMQMTEEFFKKTVKKGKLYIQKFDLKEFAENEMYLE